MVLALQQYPISIEGSRIDPDHDLIISLDDEINLMIDGYTGDLLEKALWKNEKSAVGQCVNICAYIPCWDVKYQPVGTGLVPVNPLQETFLHMKKDIDAVLGDAINTSIATKARSKLCNMWVKKST